MKTVEIKGKAVKRGNKYEVIKKYVFNKEVLDIGGAGNVYEKGKANRPRTWLHGFICKYAKRCIGLDIDKEDVNLLNKLGYSCVCQNAEEDFDLGEKFDVIVALGIIFYLDQKSFLENVKKHLKKNGYLLVGSANPFSISRFITILKFKNPSFVDNAICLYDPKTLCQLLTKYDFEVIEIFWIFTRESCIGKILKKIWGYFEGEFLVVARKAEGAVYDDKTHQEAEK